MFELFVNYQIFHFFKDSWSYNCDLRWKGFNNFDYNIGMRNINHTSGG